MSKKSKQLPLMIARGFEVMLDTLPEGVLIDPSQAEQALRHYRLRPDNHLTAAFSELLKELMACMETRKLQEQDVVAIIARMKVELDL
jgi:hypothetical protein